MEKLISHSLVDNLMQKKLRDLDISHIQKVLEIDLNRGDV